MSNKKKRGQKYQNATKFKLTAESRMTKRVQATPLDNLCQKCYDVIKWKVEYKKYKALSKNGQPGKCTDCGRRNITKAYRILCDSCAVKKV